MIQGLIDRVNQTQLPEKDADAEHLLQQSLGRNPDALYILAQTVLVQRYALEQAQKQLADLKSQLDQSRQQPPPEPQHHTSFLSSLLGRNDPPPSPPPPPRYSQPAYAPVPGYQPQQPGYPPPPPAQPYGSSSFGAPQGGAGQSGGFLRSAMQTATGVAAGALAFQGIESLLHGFGGGGGFGGGQGLGGFGGPREEIVNNYYGDTGQDDRGLSPDIEDRRGDTFGDRLADADSAGDTSTDYGADDNISSNSGSGMDTGTDNFDDSSFDSGGDGGSFDSGSDGGSFDSGGDDSSFS